MRLLGIHSLLPLIPTLLTVYYYSAVAIRGVIPPPERAESSRCETDENRLLSFPSEFRSFPFLSSDSETFPLNYFVHSSWQFFKKQARKG